MRLDWNLLKSRLRELVKIQNLSTGSSVCDGTQRPDVVAYGLRCSSDSSQSGFWLLSARVLHFIMFFSPSGKVSSERFTFSCFNSVFSLLKCVLLFQEGRGTSVSPSLFFSLQLFAALPFLDRLHFIAFLCQGTVPEVI